MTLPERREALLALAERCEKATGPDRELSASIALAVHDWLHEVDGNKPLNCRIRNKYASPVYIGGAASSMDYTASLDAAMTLVPEEGWWSVDLNGDAVVVVTAEFGEPPEVDYDRVSVPASAATPALAICAAALRARSQTPGGEGE